MKKHKNIIIVLISIVLIIILSITAVLVLKPRSVSLHKDFVYSGTSFESNLSSGYVFKDYTDYKKEFPDGTIKEGDFENNNYVLISITYDSCAEDNITPTDYKIKDNIIYVTVKYNKSCGVCPPEIINFLLKVDKDINNTKVKIDYQALNTPKCNPNVSYKPMIYIYPTHDENITIKLGKPELLKTTYPKYNGKWEITARKDGTIIDKSGRHYYGLYWEGNNTIEDSFTDGFLVHRSDLITFLEDKLEILGLNEKEANEFIIYWLPILEKNEYNLIRFADEKTINEQMPLEIVPNPDTTIRILMEYKKGSKNDTITEQQLIKKDRQGYSVIEWGGTLLK